MATQNVTSTLASPLCSPTTASRNQCVLWHAVLSAESMKPSKLKSHLEAKHPEHTKKNLDFFKRHKRYLKNQD